jgi:hypothetical protein
MDKILIGSGYFFSCYDDFISKDIDELEIIDTDEFNWLRQITGCGRDLFQIRLQKCVDDYIEYALRQNCPMAVGKFLIPEFCKAIGFTIKDLPKLSSLIDQLDQKHKYEEIIFNSYLKNGSFYLSDTQRDLAYKSYQESRKEQLNG